MKYFTSLIVALALVSVSGIGTADTVTMTQNASGNITVGTAGGLVGDFGTWFVSSDPASGPANGIDAAWISLAQTATGSELVSVSFSSDLPSDLDVSFYDADLNYLDGCLTDNLSEGTTVESCTAPAGAAFAVVDGYVGVSVDFEFSYTYEMEIGA